ncbi:putative electron transfer flavoprotein FixA [Eggerthella guodeyinii]|uniref:Electron transfer flavoprotein small subunit n=2 Tax=Eggerthella TaxID=84111 RepID=A0A6L7IN66_9ACTN|nr:MULTISPECIES: putative electron transfer flavoprotein FixA [Eggerthella]MBC5585633.1 putative electron transfer flavoprotein FixA [Eggerthella hominis]QOS68078.1 putative electron transfer flavoprotein FixA [Eggerthella guodeyinii]
MNIVVCYKIVPDEQDVVVQADRTLSFERAALKIGDYDLNAVEAGAQLAAAHGASLVCLTAGGDAVEDTKLKKAILARGPQENVAVKDASLPEAASTTTAQVLAAAVKQLGDVDLVLCGEGSADRYAQQVGVQLGEVLGLPVINAVSSIELDGDVAHVERTVGTVVERLDVPLPAVLSVVADMNTPRIPSMKDILGAGKKPSRVLSLEDVGFAGADEAIEVVSTLAPEQRDRACEILEGDDDETVQAFVARVRERL